VPGDATGARHSALPRSAHRWGFFLARLCSFGSKPYSHLEVGECLDVRPVRLKLGRDQPDVSCRRTARDADPLGEAPGRGNPDTSRYDGTVELDSNQAASQ